MSIHDIHRYDKHFCYKIQLEDNRRTDSCEQQTNEDISLQKNSPEDCYVLFDIDLDSLMSSMSESGLKPETIEEKFNELNENKCIHFHKNFWKTKSLREANN